MPERFYLEENFQIGSQVVLTDEQEIRHLSVLRIRDLEQIELINGKGQLALSTLIKKEKEKATFAIKYVFEEKLPDKEIILAIAIPRLSNLELIIEKAVELDASKIWLFSGMNSLQKKLSPHQEKRLRMIMISALKQCKRLFLPSLEIKPKLQNWTRYPGSILFGDVRKNATAFNHYKVEKFPLILCTGPEKGFHPQEIELLEKKMQAQGIKLSNNILRAETAAIAFLAIAASCKL